MSDIGCLINESFVFKEVTWKVPKEYILPNILNGVISSSLFYFAHATWVLRIVPYALNDKNEKWILLGIQRIDSKTLEHHVFYEFHLKTRKGKVFQPLQDSNTFHENCKENFIFYVKKDIFLKSKKALIKDDVLTIVCRMRTMINNKIQIYSQTDLAVAGDEMIFRPVSYSENEIPADLKEWILMQKDCDVFIKVKGRELSSHSAVFIDIEDCELSSFSDFLCYLYCENVKNISTTNVFSLFITANKYDVQDLRLQCLEFMKKNLSVDTFCDTIALAFRHSEGELIELGTDFFGKNLQEIIVTAKWQNFLNENTIRGNELLIKALASNKK